MRQLLQKFAYKMSQWMFGRYGNDALGNFLIITAFVLMLLSNVPVLFVLSPLSLGVVLWATFRTFSKNISARRKELERFLRIKNRFTGFFSTQKRIWQQRKTHRFFRRKGCRSMVRVPKNKGRIEITCTKCGTKMIKRT